MAAPLTLSPRVRPGILELMSFFGGGSGDDKNKITPARITIWVVVAGVGVYLVVSGLVGVISGGS